MPFGCLAYIETLLNYTPALHAAVVLVGLDVLTKLV